MSCIALQEGPEVGQQKLWSKKTTNNINRYTTFNIPNEFIRILSLELLLLKIGRRNRKNIYEQKEKNKEVYEEK